MCVIGWPCFYVSIPFQIPRLNSQLDPHPKYTRFAMALHCQELDAKEESKKGERQFGLKLSN